MAAPGWTGVPRHPAPTTSRFLHPRHPGFWQGRFPSTSRPVPAGGTPRVPCERDPRAPRPLAGGIPRPLVGDSPRPSSVLQGCQGTSSSLQEGISLLPLSRGMPGTPLCSPNPLTRLGPGTPSLSSLQEAFLCAPKSLQEEPPVPLVLRPENGV